ncbi:multi-copper polyphenol oxidoreductase laccase family protein [Orientia chuto str. Dubai]|uniref:Purine nucleoside phosphorylase n=1 Tax=Orientia chuto str. Dubai TaxID=1359168 RepID=A0A0F3MNQ4_9RICK|nr:peptidoglycan editing factor PgeF [Candidatus Orientia mediorientalis]KJV57072.1 multi-copper polyphenol oxidoreductase laccase family protein [Orientia chuto str. Dubai]
MQDLIPDNISYKFFDKSFIHSSGVYLLSPQNNKTIDSKQVANNKQLVINYFAAKELIVLNQKHSNSVYYAKSYSDYAPIADAIVTDLPQLILGIQTADCVPVLLFADNGTMIGAAHCGWRGAKANIIRNIISLMRNLNNMINIKSIIGPAIQQNSYEVDEHFYNTFMQESNNYQYLFKRLEFNNKFLFNLVGFVQDKLLEENVEIVKVYQDDTYSLPELYPSYRRDHHINYHILSTIVMNNA